MMTPHIITATYSTIAMLNPNETYSNQDIGCILHETEEYPISFTTKPVTKGTKLPPGWNLTCIPWNHEAGPEEDMALGEVLKYIEECTKREKLLTSIKSKLSKEEMEFVENALQLENEQWDR